MLENTFIISLDNLMRFINKTKKVFKKNGVV